MRELSFVSIIIVTVIFISPVHLISNENNNTAEILFNLANFAVESRQNQYTYPLNLVNSGYYQSQKPNRGQYGLLQYPQQNQQYFEYRPQYQKPFYNRPSYSYPYRPPGFPLTRPQNQQSLMDVLYSISRNDRLRCVPRLLCELTSDTISRGRQSLSLPSLPININMESIIGILSTIDAASGSPIPVFAKAALLGYISKGNTDSCFSAYPNCPRDADKLVLYLNNYNGGFFRFFNGINPLGTQSGLLSYPSINYPQNFQHKNSLNSYQSAEQRIQNKPVQYIPNNYINYGNNDGVVFPSNDAESNSFNFDRAPKTLTFPRDDDYQENFDRFAFRKPKELPFSINHYYSNELDLQRPLPNHKATPMIFPDRTGTGDLRLDPEELNENYKQTHYNLQNANNFIALNPDINNRDLYYRPYRPQDSSLNYYYPTNNNQNNVLFSFPN